MKRVTLSPNLWSGKNTEVIEVMDQAALKQLDNYASKSGKELQTALIKDDSDWIAPLDKLDTSHL